MVNTHFFAKTPAKQVFLPAQKNNLIFFEPNMRLPGLILRMGLGFRCPFRVGIGVLLAARLGQRPQVGRVALLSALVKAYKPYHHEAGRKSGLSLFSTHPHEQPID
jgi:hypothetical protein